MNISHTSPGAAIRGRTILPEERIHLLDKCLHMFGLSPLKTPEYQDNSPRREDLVDLYDQNSSGGQGAMHSCSCGECKSSCFCGEVEEQRTLWRLLLWWELWLPCNCKLTGRHMTPTLLPQNASRWLTSKWRRRVFWWNPPQLAFFPCQGQVSRYI